MGNSGAPSGTPPPLWRTFLPLLGGAGFLVVGVAMQWYWARSRAAAPPVLPAPAPVATVPQQELPAFPFLSPGVHFPITQATDDRHFGRGWSAQKDADFRWSVADRATFGFSATVTPSRYVLTVDFFCFTVADRLPAQRVAVALNGTVLGEETTAGGRFTSVVPEGLVAERNVLEFRLPDAARPADFGLSADDRRLGIGLRGLLLETVSLSLPGLLPPASATPPRVADPPAPPSSGSH